jgi:hypothetical protein
MPKIVERPLFEAALRKRDFFFVTVPGDEKFPWCHHIKIVEEFEHFASIIYSYLILINSIQFLHRLRNCSGVRLVHRIYTELHECTYFSAN